MNRQSSGQYMLLHRKQKTAGVTNIISSILTRSFSKEVSHIILIDFSTSEASRALAQGYENRQKVILNSIKGIAVYNLKPSKKLEALERQYRSTGLIFLKR